MSLFLTATDFSEGGNNAVFYAAALAQAANRPLLIVTAYKAQTSAATVFKGLNEVLEQEAKEALEGLRASIHDEFPKLDIRLQTAFGEADTVISQFAAQHGASLMVVGTRGKSLLDVLFFGSTSRNLSKSTKTPLLMVPPQAKLLLGGVLAYATALRDEAPRASINLLLGMKQWLQADLRVVHVFDDDNPIVPAQEVRLQQLRQQLNALSDGDGLIYDDDVINALLRHVQQTHPTILVMHLQHYGFIERLFVPSVSEALMNKIKIPMLLLPHES